MISKRCRHSDWPRMIRLSDCPVPMADFIAESSVIMIAHTHTHTHAHASASALCPVRHGRHFYQLGKRTA